MIGVNQNERDIQRKLIVLAYALPRDDRRWAPNSQFTKADIHIVWFRKASQANIAQG